MRGKWAAGIPPRNFTWIVKDQLAVSERPGGSAPNHRRVRRQEEIIWLRVQGFNRVVSLLRSPHNLAAYEEGQLAASHFALVPGGDTAEILTELYRELDRRIRSGERLLVHQEELGDRVLGVVAGYLLWSGRLPGGAQAIAVVERLVGRQMGSAGRDLVAEAVSMGPRTPEALTEVDASHEARAPLEAEASDAGGAPGEGGASYEGGAPEQAGAPRDEAGAPRDEAGAPRDEAGAPRDEAGAPRDEAGAPPQGAPSAERGPSTDGGSVAGLDRGEVGAQ